MNHATRWLHAHVLSRGLSPADVLPTVVDADSDLGLFYLEHLEAAYFGVREPARRSVIFAAPLNTWANVCEAHPLVEHLELSRCADHMWSHLFPQLFPLSNYSLTLALAHDVEFYTVDNMPEDIHMHNKVAMVCRTEGFSTVTVPALICNDLVPRVHDRIVQARRHAWGVTEVAWVLSSRAHASVTLWLTVLWRNILNELITELPSSYVALAFTPVWWRLFNALSLEARLVSLGPAALALVNTWLCRTFLLAYTWYRVLRTRDVRPPSVAHFVVMRLASPLLTVCTDLLFRLIPRWQMLCRAFCTPHFAYITAPKSTAIAARKLKSFSLVKSLSHLRHRADGCNPQSGPRADCAPASMRRRLLLRLRARVMPVVTDVITPAVEFVAEPVDADEETLERHEDAMAIQAADKAAKKAFASEVVTDENQPPR